MSLKSRDHAGPPVVFQLLIYPWLDLAGMETASHKAFAEGYVIGRDQLEIMRDAYLPNPVDRRHPHASPLLARDLTDLPPALVITAGFDPLRDEGEAYAQRLADAGVVGRLSRYEGVTHGFLQFAMNRKSERAMDEAAQRFGLALALACSAGPTSLGPSQVLRDRARRLQGLGGSMMAPCADGPARGSVAGRGDAPVQGQGEFDEVCTTSETGRDGTGGVLGSVRRDPDAGGVRRSCDAGCNAASPGVRRPSFSGRSLVAEGASGGWMFGNVVGMAVDSQDNVWVVQRPAARTVPRVRHRCSSSIRRATSSTAGAGGTLLLSGARRSTDSTSTIRTTSGSASGVAYRTTSTHVRPPTTPIS